MRATADGALCRGRSALVGGAGAAAIPRSTASSVAAANQMRCGANGNAAARLLQSPSALCNAAHVAIGAPRLRRRTASAAAGASRHSSAGGQAPSPSHNVDVERLAGAVAVAATALTLASCVGGATRAAHAEDRAWKPRRHYRRMDEHISDNWADEVVALEETAKEEAKKHMNYLREFRRKQQEEELERMRKEQDARVKRAKQLMSQPDKPRELPFSVKVGNTELVPYMFWGVIAAIVIYTTRHMWAAGVRRVRGGHFVYDRSLGGKKVWVPDAPEPGRPGSVAVRAEEFDRLTSVAAAARSAKTTKVAFQLPSWWNPPPMSFATAEMKEEKQKEADKLLRRIEQAKNRGEDYDVRDILRLRALCQEGGVTVTPKTVGARDAIYKAAVEAAVMHAQDRATSDLDLFDVGSEQPEARLVTALAGDLGLSDERAAGFVRAAAAAAARSRLLDAIKHLKEGNEVDALVALTYLASLAECLPVVEPGAAEPELIASSLSGASTLEERQKLFYILGQLSPGSAHLFAEMLGFEAELVVPKLNADVKAYEDSQGAQRQQ